MSVRPTDTGPYHNPPSLKQTCSQCRSSVEPFLPFHLTPCQWSVCETEHSDRDSSETGSTFTDKLWTLTIRTFRLFYARMSTQRIVTVPLAVNHRLGTHSSAGRDLIMLSRVEYVPYETGLKTTLTNPCVCWVREEWIGLVKNRSWVLTSGSGRLCVVMCDMWMEVQGVGERGSDREGMWKF